jgi:hypothetical protein
MRVSISITHEESWFSSILSKAYQTLPHVTECVDLQALQIFCESVLKRRITADLLETANRCPRTFEEYTARYDETCSPANHAIFVANCALATGTGILLMYGLSKCLKPQKAATKREVNLARYRVNFNKMKVNKNRH